MDARCLAGPQLVGETTGPSKKHPAHHPAFTGTEDLAICDSIVAACDKPTIMVLRTKVGSCGISLAVDTGDTVNVLSEDSFRTKISRWPIVVTPE